MAAILYLEQINDILENIANNICIKEPVKKEEENKNNLLILPLFPDEDIYVEESTTLNWSKIRRMSKLLYLFPDLPPDQTDV